MSASISPRRSSWRILLPLLAVTLVAVAWLEFGQGPADEVAGAAVRPRNGEDSPRTPRADRSSAEEGRPAAAAADAGEAAKGELRMERQPRQAGGVAPGSDPFAKADWNPPPPPPPPALLRRETMELPPKPVAPPIPYAYFGMSIQDGRTVVFVMRDQRTFVLAVGEVIENLYRVEEIRPADVVLTYLPLNERQVMKIGTVPP